jgi:hypothetical protein
MWWMGRRHPVNLSARKHCSLGSQHKRDKKRFKSPRLRNYLVVLAFCGIMAIVSLIFMFISDSDYRRMRHVLTHGKKTKAKVVAKEIILLTKYYWHWKVKYVFKDENGRKFRGTDRNIEKSHYFQLERGGEVEIVYDPEDPDYSAVFEGERTCGKYKGDTTAWILLFAFAMLLAAGSSAWVAYERWKEKKYNEARLAGKRKAREEKKDF